METKETVAETKEKESTAAGKATETKKRGRKTSTAGKADGAESGTKKRGRKADSTKEVASKPNVVLQYADKSVSFDTLVQNAKNVWEFDMGRKVSEIKDINLYVKPEEGKVYFVVNNSETGDFSL